MSKLIKGSIDLTKIKKEHIFESEKGGKYINVDIWINDDADKYGNHAGIKQTYKIGDGFEGHYIGNGKKKFGWGESQAANAPQKSTPQNESFANDNDDDLPF